MSCSLNSAKKWLVENGYLDTDQKTVLKAKNLQKAESIFYERAIYKYGSVPEAYKRNNIIRQSKFGKFVPNLGFFTWADVKNARGEFTEQYIRDEQSKNLKKEKLYQKNQTVSNGSLIKKGVSELFESNSELANAVYSALGFNNVITSNDRVVFGHPTIGKSYLKKQGDNKFISLDDDYATEINSKVKEIADKYSVTTYQVKDGSAQKWNNEYNQIMQEMFNVAKQRAISENKTLFTSNTNLLRNNAESFDKVINLTDKEFERRIQERGAKYDIKEWKSQINEAISKLPANKVINTDRYLSDLFILPQQKLQALQQYSQYLDTIFSNSKVKEIVYHGTDTELDKFDKSFRGINTGDANFNDGTEIDSKNAFFFSNNINSTFQYSFIKQLQKIQDLSSALLYLSLDLSQENAKVIRQISPGLADTLNIKKKELSNENFKVYLKKLAKQYSDANSNLGIGFLNRYNNYYNSKKHIQEIILKKEKILNESYYDLKETVYIYDEKYGATKIYKTGEITSSDVILNKKNIKELSSEDFDYLTQKAISINKDFFDKFEKSKSKYKLTPKTYSVLLDIKNPLIKDFKSIPFVSQMGGEKSAQYEASKLTKKAVDMGKDSVIFENIEDPYLADNYGVFEPEQIHILGSKQDIEGFKEFVEQSDNQKIPDVVSALPTLKCK